MHTHAMLISVKKKKKKDVKEIPNLNATSYR